MGVVGTAMASAMLMDRDREAGAAAMKRSDRDQGAAAAPAWSRPGPELALPAGFSYTTFGCVRVRDDGRVHHPADPRRHGCVRRAATGRSGIVRNHELGEGNDIPAGTVIGDPKTAYDKKSPGGTVTLVVDAATGELRSDWISLNGTDTNCAGMPTPWGTWLTCEETVTGVNPGGRSRTATCSRWTRTPTQRRSASPIKAMGRMLHEAGAVDPETGVVYMTEDEGPDGFYRYVPTDPGNLTAGGTLQMLAVKGQARVQHDRAVRPWARYCRRTG